MILNLHKYTYSIRGIFVLSGGIQRYSLCSYQTDVMIFVTYVNAALCRTQGVGKKIWKSGCTNIIKMTNLFVCWLNTALRSPHTWFATSTVINPLVHPLRGPHIELFSSTMDTVLSEVNLGLPLPHLPISILN